MFPHLAKRACPERVQEEPEREVPLMPVPPPDITGPSSAPIAEEADPAPSGASDGATVVEEVLDQKNTSAFAPPPS